MNPMSDQYDKEVAELEKVYAEESEAQHGRLVRAMREALAQSGALAVGGGWVPVSSAEALCARWEGASESYRGGGDISQAVANAFEICSKELRREIGRANKRQPAPNVPDEPRAGVALSDHLSHEKPN